MCDTKRYFQMYQEIKLLKPNDTMQLILESQDSEQQAFFELLGDFLLQQKQKKVVDGKMF